MVDKLNLVTSKLAKVWTCAKSNPKTAILGIVALAVAHELYHYVVS